MNSYANTTEVSVAKTRAELEGLLTRSGATSFGSMMEAHRATVAFEIAGKRVRFHLPLPSREDKKFTRSYVSKYSTRPSTQEECSKKWEQACRSAWRALFFSIKAKLVACQEGITTFEDEFLAHFVLPGGATVGERFIPKLLEMQRTGEIPALQLTTGAA